LESLSGIMQNIKLFRASLGETGKGYTDAQLEQLDRELNVLAELLLHLHVAAEVDDHNAAPIMKGKGRTHITYS
jgi:hypothetical protein